jgi:hypothetical protein
MMGWTIRILIRDQDGGAVGCRIRNLPRGDSAAGSDRVLNEKTAAKSLRKLLRQDARDVRPRMSPQPNPPVTDFTRIPSNKTRYP